MSRYRGPKNRIARRFGANIFGRARNPLLRKPNPPGVHGGRRRKKSDFGLQLEEKQKLKACYGMILEKQLLGNFRKAAALEGNTALHFMQRLECRLDVVVYRLQFARTIFAAQQLVAHGHVLVNGKKVDIRSFQVKPGMEIAIKPKSQKNKAISEALSLTSNTLPEYLECDKDNLKGKLLALPDLEQIEAQLPLPVNIPVVCEFLQHQH